MNNTSWILAEDSVLLSCHGGYQRNVTPATGKSHRFRLQYPFFDHCCFRQYSHFHCFPQRIVLPSSFKTLVSMSRCHRSLRWRHSTADVCYLPALVSRQMFERLLFRCISFVYCNHDSLWSVIGYNDRNRRGPIVEDEVQTSCNSQACWSGRRLLLVPEHCGQPVGVWRQACLPQFKLCLNVTECGDSNILLPENFFHSSSAEDTGSCRRTLPMLSRAAEESK